MASSTLPIVAGHSLLPKSNFLGLTHTLKAPSSNTPPPTPPPISTLKVSAKFNLFEILGGRGLLGEVGLEEELKKKKTIILPQEPPSPPTTTDESAESTAAILPEDGFGKELLGLTGGFPGGEKGLQKFIEENPPPKKGEKSSSSSVDEVKLGLVKKPKVPELPILMPGMIAIVKNTNSPYYMLCGIVQRITDGRAGVLFEGGNWDRLITFRIEELERRQKGPPMVSPKSVVLESLAENKNP